MSGAPSRALISAEMGRVSGVAGEIDAAPTACDHVSAPKAFLPIEQAARRKMLRWHEGYFERIVDLNHLPPIELTQILEPERPEEPRVAGGSKHGRGEAFSELDQRRDIQMVIVVVAQENDVDLRKVRERHPGLAHAPGTDPAKRACALRPDRVGQDGGAAGLDQKRRMVDEGDGDIIRFEHLVQPGHALVLDPSRPLAAPLARHLEGAAP